jgi:hypothetical protein
MPNPFSSVQVPSEDATPIKRRYSLTTDVVAFRRCGRQYGTFKIHDYAPAYQTQLYYGTIIHQVLDRCHTHYHGIIDESTRGQIPDNGRVLSNVEIEAYFTDLRQSEIDGTPPPLPPSDILSYFIEVENGLKSRGIRAITDDLRLKAVRVLQYFNSLEGAELYPRVLDTEHRLQADKGNHIIQGVVDLLVDPESHSENPGDCEIWDYKGTDPLKLTKRDKETYQFQMQVYAHLYEMKHGVRPQRAVLYFINELDGDTCPTARPIHAIEVVDLNNEDIEEAVKEFVRTVHDIEDARKRDEWLPAQKGQVSEQDCAICDLRWNCPTPEVKIRYP